MSSRTPRRIVPAEHELRCYPPDARDRFLADPADWLPGTVTRRGSSTFAVRMPGSGPGLDLQFRVGTPWTRGTSTTRHLRVAFVDPPVGLAWVLPEVVGDLNLLGEQRLRLRFEATTVGRWLSVRRALAGWVMRTVTTGIAARLTAGTPCLPRPASPHSARQRRAAGATGRRPRPGRAAGPRPDRPAHRPRPVGHPGC